MTENQIRDAVHKHLQLETKQLISKFIWKSTNKTRNRVFWQNYSFKKEYNIRFGSKWTGRADLVLLIDNNPLVIVECKAPGLIGRGKIQLESYLNASRANLGIFANKSDPGGWRYYDNSIGFNEISRSEFWEKIKIAFDTERNIEKEAQQLKQQRVEARAKELAYENPAIIQARTDEIIEAEAKTRVAENAIQGVVAQKLQGKINQQQKQLESLREENNSNWGCAMWGWILFGISIFILIISHQ